MLLSSRYAQLLWSIDAFHQTGKQRSLCGQGLVSTAGNYKVFKYNNCKILNLFARCMAHPITFAEGNNKYVCVFSGCENRGIFSSW